MSFDRLTVDSVIHRSEALLASRVGDDVVMMDIEEGSYYGLERVAVRIWELTEQPIAVGVLCERLVAEYQVSPDQCRAEVMAFLGELLDRKIVRAARPVDGGA